MLLIGRETIIGSDVLNESALKYLRTKRYRLSAYKNTEVTKMLKIITVLGDKQEPVITLMKIT